MSHYDNLHEEWAASLQAAPVSLISVTGLLTSNYSQTNVPKLVEELLTLAQKGYQYVVLSLGISDHGYQHWIKPTFVSERPHGNDKLHIRTVITVCETILHTKETI